MKIRRLVLGMLLIVAMLANIGPIPAIEHQSGNTSLINNQDTITNLAFPSQNGWSQKAKITPVMFFDCFDCCCCCDPFVEDVFIDEFDPFFF